MQPTSRQKTLPFHSENYYRQTTEVEVLANRTWAYNSGLVVPKMEEQIKGNGTHALPRFLFGNAANFNRPIEEYERALSMEMWTQTEMEDFSLIADDRERIDFLQKENEALRERVHLLEKELRVHSDLLNQIHATAALKPKPHEIIDHISPTPPATPILNQQHLQHTSPNTTHAPYVAPLPTSANYQVMNSNTQVMNNIQTNGVSVPHSDSVKYRIVSNPREKHENQSVEPIEIQLAEEDGALNLNCSADSGRLEICLGEQEAQHNQEAANFKNEIPSEDNLPPLPAQSGILVKRRKFSPEMKHCINAPMQSPQVLSANLPAELQTPNTLRHLQDDNVMVSIGPNNTRVPYKLYESINWDNPSIATRKLLMAIFDRNTLATHSMTGKPSPAFKGQAKPQKQRLDPRITEDIVFVVTRRCKVSDKEVRNAITTKCADENKMMKLQMNKKNTQRNSNTNKENHQYPSQQHMH